MPSPFLARPRSRLAALAVAALLAACSPAFNWREVPIAGAGLVAMLPCKADRATRALPLGAESVQVDMTGCEAGGATFAIAHASANGPEQAEAWLRAWHSATRGQLGEAEVAESSASLPRATAVPAPLRLEVAPPPQGASATPLQVLWFAQSQKDGSVALYQATVLGRPSSVEASKTFFEGLRLP
ncbi:hypothetical protein QMO14_12875 [Variovorax sp. CAN2819]|uniref:hypothetical protein n=1 Tax=Variovorax sp. CAN15 TaxID=3046727 RepID=UPI002648F284|nr:hypothetical protein [Variovorax sp. CAN15]MDN6884492.1 hypothetical protein [Variovorax sp. CAN15]